MRFKDRSDAAKLLSVELAKFKSEPVVVLAVPRGGVVLGVEIARALKAPLDLVITRKVGHPENPEYAVCVVAEDSHLICNEGERARLDPIWLEKAIKLEQEEAVRRRRVYWGGRVRPDVKGKTAIVVDDGIATGLTFLAALAEVRHLGPKKIVAAVPVMPAENEAKVRAVADEIVCLFVDRDFQGAVGSYYDDFPQVSDEEVIELLKEK